MLIKGILILLFIFSHEAQALCGSLNITNSPNSVSLNANINPKIQFNIYRTWSNGNCNYRVGVDRGSSSSYDRKLSNGAYVLDIDFSKNSSMNTILKDPANANNSNEYIDGRMSNRDTVNQHDFYTELTLDPNAPSGIYTDTFLIKAYLDFGIFLILSDTRNIQFTYQIPDQVSLSLVNTNAPFNPNDTTQDINFGSLYGGATRKMDVVVQSNSGYKIDITSTNNGKIKHIGHPSTIDYVFKANGQIKDLSASSSSPVTIATGTGNHPNDGFRVPLEFVIQSTVNKVSGEYKDYLTITVTSHL
ncbi:MAG: hypothetical protein CME62_16785 [Halobacteriovoraceae bacterium]|nr:hypothetical protein [Halobacteriovoraceae bacterium]|tara:strand:+ start:3269 stop:4177 length:909 start_codon:yes stop_codon:yes gene_type:complete